MGIVDRWKPVAGAAAAVLLVSGCGTGTAEREASDAAAAFVAAEPAQACTRLAPNTLKALESHTNTACEAVLADVELPRGTPPTRVDLAGEGAQVRFGDQVVFLARFPDGWRVTAAGCRRTHPDPSIPYQCEVSP